MRRKAGDDSVPRLIGQHLHLAGRKQPRIVLSKRGEFQKAFAKLSNYEADLVHMRVQKQPARPGNAATPDADNAAHRVNIRIVHQRPHKLRYFFRGRPLEAGGRGDLAKLL